MKCVRKKPAEAIAWHRDNDIEVMKFIASHIDGVNNYGKRIKMIMSTLGFSSIKVDGYFVIDNGFLEFFTNEEFDKMYKQIEKKHE